MDSCKHADRVDGNDTYHNVGNPAHGRKLIHCPNGHNSNIHSSTNGFDSEAALRSAFGGDIKRSAGYTEDEGDYPNTLLFPGTKNEVEFVWLDTINFSRIACIKISGQETDWKTKEGITIGTRLKELEMFNKKSFTFYGFGWDYSGMTTWDRGHLFDRRSV